MTTQFEAELKKPPFLAAFVQLSKNQL